MSILSRLKNIWGLGVPSVEGAQNFMSGLSFMSWDGIEVDVHSLEGVREVYDRCSTLKTVVNRCAMAMTNGKWWVVDAKDNDVMKSYPSLAQLFKKPNPLQTWSEFTAQMDVFRQLYGEVFVLAVVPAGFTVQDATALWAVNPRYIEVEMTRKLYMQSLLDEIVKDYYMTVDGVRYKLDRNCVLHIKDANQHLLLSASDIRGRSRLTGLENSIRNIVQAEEAIYALNRDRGAQGILSNDSKDAVGTIPLTPEEKESIQKTYKSTYGLSASQRKIIITDSSLKWLQMSFNVKDLMLFEGIEKNIQLIADAFGYPYELLAGVAGATYENKREAKKFIYQDTIIPISKIYAEKFSEFFCLGDHLVMIDFSEVECLKAAEADKADTFSKQNQALKIAFESGVISRVEWRLAIGMDEEIYKPDETPEDNENQQWQNEFESEDSAEEKPE